MSYFTKKIRSEGKQAKNDRITVCTVMSHRDMASGHKADFISDNVIQRELPDKTFAAGSLLN
jgi:hypothetical protein